MARCAAVTPTRIADFDPADSDALVRMWRASFEFGVGITDHHPLEEQARYLREQLAPAYRLRVAWRGDAMVGFLAANAQWVEALYVRVEHIGQGIGAQLLNLAQAESSGSLELYTFPRNQRACRFYERHGFVETARGFVQMWQLPDVKYRWVRGTQPAQARASVSK